jgi:ATP-dependent RNA helicase HelY
VLWSPFVTFDQIASLAASRSFELRSAFRPTYNMAANLVRRYDADAAHRLLAASFAQFQANRDVERLDARTAKLRATLDGLGASDTRRRERVERELADLRRRIRLRTESLVVRFDHILQVLEAWGHLDGWALTERGELLVRIFHESDLLVAEAISTGLFDGLEPASLAGLVSCLTYEHRSPTPPPDPWFPSRDLRRRFAELELLAEELREAEEHYELPLTRRPDPTFLPLAHAWATGDDLHEVLEDDEVLTGGDFVRNARQLIDLLRQVGETAVVADTREAARSAAEAITRGVVAASAMLVDEEGEPLELDDDRAHHDEEGAGGADPQG